MSWTHFFIFLYPKIKIKIKIVYDKITYHYCKKRRCYHPKITYYSHVCFVERQNYSLKTFPLRENISNSPINNFQIFFPISIKWISRPSRISVNGVGAGGLTNWRVDLSKNVYNNHTKIVTVFSVSLNIRFVTPYFNLYFIWFSFFFG